MAEECIHGLAAGLCDICYPKARPEPPRPVAKTRPRDVRPPSGPRTSAQRPPAGKPVDVGRQRLFHLTHMRNLPGILSDGRISAEATPVVDISAPSTREERRLATVAGPDSATVAEFVPFFLDPDASLWRDIRSGTVDPRLSADARRHELAEYVLVVTTIGDVGPEVVMADDDAAGAATRFASTPETMERMLRRLRADETALARGELLVHGTVPFERIALIGVAHDRARDAVREVLGSTSFTPRVAVHPPWFARPE